MRCIAFLLTLACMTPAFAADTLVVAAEDGVFAPGLSSKWWADGPAIHFQVDTDARAKSIAAQLASALAGAEVSAKGDLVVVQGIPEPVLLDQLSVFSLSEGGGSDPLADLAGVGVGVVAFSAPEGGGSIRATNPNFAIPVGALGESSPETRFEAQVLSVERGEFPRVVVKLRVKTRTRDLATRKQFPRNSVLIAPVLMSGGDGEIDFEANRTRRNLVAYYLERGDLVVVHALKDDADRPHIDWIERK